MRALVAIAAVLACTRAAAAQPTGRIVGKVSVSEQSGKSAAGAVAIVYVVGFSEPAATPAKDAAATIEQKNRKFIPDLVAITVGETVRFPNSDSILHNVFSQSAARKFDLGSYKKGEAKDKTFPNPGVIDVFCNIHVEMAATILVLPNRHHVQVAADGTYVLDGVPPGTWQVFAYARRVAKPLQQRVTVAPGADATADFALVRGAEPEHPNKFGEAYEPGYD